MSPPSSLSLVQRNHTGGIGAASVVGEDHHHHHHNHHPSRRLLLEAEEGVTDDKEEEAMASSKNCYLTGEEDHGSIGQMVYDFIGQAVKMVEESERKEKIQMMDNMMMIHNGGHDDNHGADNGQDEESDSESCVPSLLCSSILKSSINVPLFSPVASTSSSTLGIHGLSENTCFNSTIPIVMSPPSPSEMEMTTTTTTGSVVINTTIDDNEDDSSTNNMNIELLTPPATDPDSPASETIIGLIPDEVCLLESEDSKVAIDESTCQSSSTCQASSSSSSATTNGSSSSMVCKWRNCDWPGTYDDLVDHIREIHVELQPYHNHRHIVSKSSLNDSSNNDNDNNNNQDDEIDLVPTAFSAISAKSVRSDANDRDSRRSMDDESTSQYQLRTKSAAISSPNHSEENQQYVCLWQGCKVYGKGSSSRNWLERHVLLHSGPRPFKCIFDQCGSRFKSRPALEKHVNSHFNGSFIDTGSNGNSICGDDGGSDIFNDNSGPMMMRAKSANGGDQNHHHHHHHHHRHHHNNHIHNQQRGTSMSSSSLGLTTPNKLLKRKKVSKPKRKCVNLKSSQDFFDLRVMEHVQYSLCQLNAITGVDISGHQREITFHTRVIARRKEDKSGQCKVLLHYHPENILPDVWVPESQLDELKVKTLPLSHLPSDALAELMELSPVPREGRKQRRK